MKTRYWKMDTRTPFLRGIRACVLATLAITAADASATLLTWNGGAAGNWDTTTPNWTGASTTWVDGSSTAGLSTNATITLQQSITADGLQIPGGKVVTLQPAGSQTLTLDGLEASDINFPQNLATLTINCGLNVSGPQSWTNVGGGNQVNLAGNLTGSSNLGIAAINVSLTGNNAGYSGNFSTGGNVQIGNQTPFGTGTVSLNANTLTVQPVQGPTTINNTLILGVQNNSDRVLSFLGSYPLTFTGGLTRPVYPTPKQTFDVQSTADVTFSGIISGSGYTVWKAGTGRLIFGGNNTYSGTTTVQTGTLLVNGTTTGQGLYTVQTNATLGGTGSIGASVTAAGGTIAPGASIGTLAVSGAADLSSGILAVQFDTASADRLNVGGLLTLGGSSALSLSTTGALVGTGVTYTIGQYGSLAGQFASLAGPNNFSYSIDYSGGLVRLTVVPEPAAALLLALGALASVGRRRHARTIPR